MSQRALQTLLRPTARLLSPTICSCRVFRLAPTVPSPFLSRAYASKKKAGKKNTAVIEDDDEPAPVAKGGKGKKGKGKFVEEDDAGANGEDQGSFDLKAVESSMDEAVDKLRVGLKSVVGRVGRVSPGASLQALARF